jgi:hypothetical protein
LFELWAWDDAQYGIHLIEDDHPGRLPVERQQLLCRTHQPGGVALGICYADGEHGLDSV